MLGSHRCKVVVLVAPIRSRGMLSGDTKCSGSGRHSGSRTKAGNVVLSQSEVTTRKRRGW